MRPTEIRLVVAVGADEAPVRGHELDRRHLVGADAVLAREPRESAAERVADHADVGRGAGERRETVRGRCLDDLDPERSRLGTGDARLGPDRDGSHAVGLQQDRVAELAAQRGGVVAGALRRHAQAVSAGEVDDLDHVPGRLRQGDGGRPLVDGEIPRLTGAVPAFVAGGDDVSAQASPENVESEFGVGGGEQLSIHRCTSSNGRWRRCNWA